MSKKGSDKTSQPRNDDAGGKNSDTGIVIYTGVIDFYQPLRDFYTPLHLFTPLYKSPFAKQQHKSAIILIWFWRYHAQDQAIEAYFQ